LVFAVSHKAEEFCVFSCYKIRYKILKWSTDKNL